MSLFSFRKYFKTAPFVAATLGIASTSLIAQVEEPMQSAITFAESQMQIMLNDLGYGSSGVNPNWAANPAVFPKTTTGTGDTEWDFKTASSNWGSGFTPGIFWDLYELTGDPLWAEKADAWTTGIDERNLEFSGGDMRMNIGFHMMNSLARRVAHTGGAPGDDAVLSDSADTLQLSWMPAVGSLWSFSWNNGFKIGGLYGGWSNYKNTIVDSTPNLEIFFYQAKRESDATLWTQALSHLNVIIRDHLRPDGSTVQLVAYNTTTGAPVEPNGGARGWQGYSWASTWSRGQGWALHGFATAWRETADIAAGESFDDLYRFYRNNAPADGVPYWDFNAPDLTDEELETRYPGKNAPAIRYSRDSSAAALAASALLEACNLADDPNLRQEYFSYGRKILASLSEPGYLACDGSYIPTKKSILRQGSYTFPGVDKGQVWGDFYYVQALRRYQRLVEPDSIFHTIADWGDLANYTTLHAHRWHVMPDEGDARLRLQTEEAGTSTAPTAPLLYRKATASDFTASFQFRADENLAINTEADAILIFGYTDPANYSYARFSTASHTTGLYHLNNDTVETVATVTNGWSGQGYHDALVTRTGNEVTLTLGGSDILTTSDARLGTQGYLGLASHADSMYFDALQVGGTLAAAELSPRSLWREARFTEPLSFAARDGSDSNSNGQSNLMEYALGTSEGQPGLRMGHSPEGSPTVEYSYNEDRHDIVYKLWRSIDGAETWQHIETRTPTGSGGWQIASHEPDMITQPNAFYRLEVVPLH